MKQFCLAIVRNGVVEQVLAKQPTIADPEDIKEIMNFAIDEYLNDLEGEDE